VAGYVLGADYEAARDALLEALETPGPGELIHPWVGTRTVVVLACRVRESSDRGGVAEFEAEFAETATPITPTAVVDSVSAVESAAEETETATEAAFLEAYEPATGIAESAEAAVMAIGDAVDSATRATVLGGEALASVRTAAASLVSSARALAESPEELIAAVRSVVTELEEGVRASGVVDVARRLLALYSVSLGDRPTGTTPQRVQEQANYDAIQAAYRREVIAHAATAAVHDEWSSYEEAVTVRDQVLETLDEHLLEASDDSAYESLVSLREAVVTAVPPPDQDLPHLVEVSVPTTLPSLVLAHRIYGDVARELEVCARNRLADPLMVRGGSTLEILTEVQ
jgi:prophage DNA circulation protein